MFLGLVSGFIQDDRHKDGAKLSMLSCLPGLSQSRPAQRRHKDTAELPTLLLGSKTLRFKSIIDGLELLFVGPDIYIQLFCIFPF